MFNFFISIIVFLIPQLHAAENQLTCPGIQINVADGCYYKSLRESHRLSFRERTFGFKEACGRLKNQLLENANKWADESCIGGRENLRHKFYLPDHYSPSRETECHLAPESRLVEGGAILNLAATCRNGVNLCKIFNNPLCNTCSRLPSELRIFPLDSNFEARAHMGEGQFRPVNIDPACRTALDLQARQLRNEGASGWNLQIRDRLVNSCSWTVTNLGGDFKCVCAAGGKCTLEEQLTVVPERPNTDAVETTN